MNPLNKMIRRLHPGIYVTPLHVWADICQSDASHAMAYPPFDTIPKHPKELWQRNSMAARR